MLKTTDKPYVIYSKNNMPTFTDLDQFGREFHPGIAEVLSGYAQGVYEYEEALMLCLRMLMDEYMAIREAARRQTGEGFGPLVRFQITGDG